MSSWSDLETMVAVGGPQAGSARGKRGPGEVREARDRREGGSHRPPAAPDAGTPLLGPGPTPPAARPAPLPRAASPALALPRRQAEAARPLGPTAVCRETRARRRWTFCRLLCRFSNARASSRGSRRAPLPPSNQARRPSAGGELEDKG